VSPIQCVATHPTPSRFVSGKYYTTALLGASSAGTIDNVPDYKNDLCTTLEGYVCMIQVSFSFRDTNYLHFPLPTLMAARCCACL
jgi:hypothetical protein